MPPSMPVAVQQLFQYNYHCIGKLKMDFPTLNLGQAKTNCPIKLFAETRNAIIKETALLGE